MIVLVGIIALAWTVASFYFIQKEQDLINPICFKLFMGLTVVCVMLWTSQLFNPALSRFEGAAEINPSFAISVLAGAVMAAAITGPIACIRYLLWERELRKERERERL